MGWLGGCSYRNEWVMCIRICHVDAIRIHRVYIAKERLFVADQAMLFEASRLLRDQTAYVPARV